MSIPSTSDRCHKPPTSIVPESENGDDRISAAYREALRTFSEDTVEAITEARGMDDLTKALDKARHDLLGASWYRKGLESLNDPLKKLGLLVPLGKAFASLDPTAATAFGIVTAVIGVRQCRHPYRILLFSPRAHHDTQ